MTSTRKPKTLNPKTFEEAKLEYFESRKNLGVTAKTCQNIKERFRTFPFHEITIKTVEKYIRLLLDMDVRYSTRLAYLGNIRAFANWCVQRGYLEKNPVIKPQWKKERPDRQPFTEEEYHRILDVCKKVSLRGTIYLTRKLDPDDALAWTYAVTVGWHTGLRLGDVCNLKWDYVDPVNRVITLNPRKTIRLSKKVAIPYGDEVAAILEQARTQFDNREFVCPPLERSYRLGMNPKSYFLTICAHAEVSKSFHCFRHGFITRLLSKNYSAELVAGVTGQSLSQVLGYCQISMDTKRAMLGLTQPEKAA